MRKQTFLHSALSWLVCAIGLFDLLLTLATSQAREGALSKLVADLHLPVGTPEVGTAVSRCNAGLASWSGYHFFVGFAILLVGLLLVATGTPAHPSSSPTSSPQD